VSIETEEDFTPRSSYVHLWGAQPASTRAFRLSGLNLGPCWSIRMGCILISRTLSAHHCQLPYGPMVMRVPMDQRAAPQSIPCFGTCESGHGAYVGWFLSGRLPAPSR
jgi:hypothetical protein